MRGRQMLGIRWHLPMGEAKRRGFAYLSLTLAYNRNRQARTDARRSAGVCVADLSSRRYRRRMHAGQGLDNPALDFYRLATAQCMDRIFSQPPTR